MSNISNERQSQAGFAITLESESVVNAIVCSNADHSELEKLCQSRNYRQCLFMLERAAGICSHSHSLNYCLAFEELAGVQAPPRAQALRVLAAEIERIQHHLLWIGVIVRHIGLEQLNSLLRDERNRLLDFMESWTGSRMLYALNIPGGVSRDLEIFTANDLEQLLKELRNKLSAYDQRAGAIQTRTGGVGVLNEDAARLFGAVGPLARSGGINNDVRIIEPYAAYSGIEFNGAVDQRGDVQARLTILRAEIEYSIDLILNLLASLPGGHISVSVPARLPIGEVIHRVESPLGEEIIYLRSNGSFCPERINLRTATDVNRNSLNRMLESCHLADMPLIVASVDPCLKVQMREGR